MARGQLPKASRPSYRGLSPRLHMGLSDMLPHSGLARPRFHRSSSKDSSRSRSGGESDDEGPLSGSAVIPNVDAYLDDTMPEEYFKYDMLKLIHNLRIHGWNIVKEDMSDDIEAERISGALTNAVYKVSPPSYVKERIKKEYGGRPYHHKVPPALLLRVYGLQADQLIDRDEELKVVEMLTRHKIGAKLLGTFSNGRFEQFLNAKPLTKDDLHNPDTSVQIAKRMRDLHDHLSLTKQQLEDGPVVFVKLESWEKAFIDRIKELQVSSPDCVKAMLGCDDLSDLFEAIRWYKSYFTEKYDQKYMHDVVFCHNDTQYGNILRVEPPKGSPLLMPQNEHRRLVVIDFEYAGQNKRAYDIANHFCEWMGDYHHPMYPHHIWLDRFPNREEQLLFISSYVEHGASVLSEDILDPQIAQLHSEVKDWLPACSLHWAFWGVIQAPTDVEAKIQRLEKQLSGFSGYNFERWTADEDQMLESDEVFDYLSYSQEKFALFWRDLRALKG